VRIRAVPIVADALLEANWKNFDADTLQRFLIDRNWGKQTNWHLLAPIRFISQSYLVFLLDHWLVHYKSSSIRTWRVFENCEFIWSNFIMRAVLQ
jgi:hypothetical protein